MPTPGNAHEAASRQTRLDLLEAGLRLLVSQPASSALSHLTATKIATEAGRTSGAFFHQWPTLEAYLQDFISYVLRPELAVSLQNTTAQITAGLARGSTFTEALAQAGRGVPEQTAHDPQTIIELLMWNRALHDTDFRQTVARHYHALDVGAGEAYEQLMTILGREPRPPFTAETIGAVCASVAQGLSMRASLTPGFYPAEIFGWMIAALIPLLTRQPGDQSDAGHYVQDLPLHHSSRSRPDRSPGA